MWLQARPYTHTNTYDENAVLAALFLEVLIVLLFFVISLILLSSEHTPGPACLSFISFMENPLWSPMRSLNVECSWTSKVQPSGTVRVCSATCRSVWKHQL